MHLVHGVFKTLEIVAGNFVNGPDVDHALAGRLGEGREGGLRALAEKAEDHAQMFARRISPDAHLVLVRGLFRRLVDAGAVAAEFPAVIDAAHGVLLHPAQMHRRAAMGAARVDHLRMAGLAAIKGVIMAHDADRLGPAGRHIGGDAHRRPELPHEGPAGRAFEGGGDVNLGAGRRLGRRLC